MSTMLSEECFIYELASELTSDMLEANDLAIWFLEEVVYPQSLCIPSPYLEGFLVVAQREKYPS